jgi:hypothetical protein
MYLVRLGSYKYEVISILYFNFLKKYIKLTYLLNDSIFSEIKIK